MKSICLDESYICGAASVESVEGGFRSWRLPHHNRYLFHTPDEELLMRARLNSGVRVSLETDTSQLKLCFKPLEPAHDAIKVHLFDAVIDNEIVEVVQCDEGNTEAFFENLGKGKKTLEIWLPPGTCVIITGIKMDNNAFARPMPDRRPLWVTWGSSLTHCIRAGSAARTWPAAVARSNDLNLLNLGFGGHCCLDPTVAMYIRDLPADYISLKLGINTMGRGMHPRIYAALLNAVLQIILEKHSHTPFVLISPFAHPPTENSPNVSGYTMSQLRHDMLNTYTRFKRAGANNLYYVSGVRIFSQDDIEKYTQDQCHAGAEGIDLQGERFNDIVMPLLRGK